VWAFEDGKARHGWVFADVPSLMAQLTEPQQERQLAAGASRK
jgi:hypothetical protein